MVSDVRDLDMLRVWMLLVVGAAAMRQVAEDALAHSAVKAGWNEWELRRAVDEVAEKFPKKQREHLKEKVMKAFKNGELHEKGQDWARYIWN